MTGQYLEAGCCVDYTMTLWLVVFTIAVLAIITWIEVRRLNK